jgi:hypothetical protein
MKGHDKTRVGGIAYRRQFHRRNSNANSHFYHEVSMTFPPYQVLQHALRNDFMAFLAKTVATVSPGATYLPNWHLEAISAHLQDAAAGKLRRLIITMPPRMLKSVTVSVAWPAWILGHSPQARVMVASYAQSLSSKHSQDCRLVMQSPWYRQIFPATQLAFDQNEKEKFVTSARGHRIAVSVGGAATGEGGNILIVDDPLNPLQALQASARESCNAWFEHTFASRLDDKRRGSIVVVMQRLHAEDLAGYLSRKVGWHVLSLPAIAPEDCEIRWGNFYKFRYAGEALHPAREDAEMLAQLAREIGSANFAAQYMQMPAHSSHAMLKPEWFSRFALEQWHEGVVP